jgi:hypothetical protein
VDQARKPQALEQLVVVAAAAGHMLNCFLRFPLWGQLKLSLLALVERLLRLRLLMVTLVETQPLAPCSLDMVAQEE